MPHDRIASRRAFLSHTAAGLAGAAVGAWSTRSRADDQKPFKVAALITAFFPMSHAHVILENFLVPYLFNGKVTRSDMQIAGMFVDQIAANDMSRDVAKQFQIPVYPSIADAMCLGKDKLAVDAVLLIGEHGSYPTNPKGQVEYPRKQFFDQAVDVFKRRGRAVPLFCDKHLSYRWDWAKEMVATARDLRMPFMAGSSVPLAQRRPPLELPAGAKIKQAVSIHGGGVESYDFHALEVLQSLVEARDGGETGVKRVEFLIGEPLWKAAENGVWSADLAADAMAAEVGHDHELVTWLRSRGKTSPKEETPIHGIVVDYRDGLRGVALKVGNNGIRWNFACQLAGEDRSRATSFYVGPWQNRNLFKALSHAIQTHFRQGKAPYPVERTLMVSGVLDAAMDARLAGKAVGTPQLAWAYAPQDYRAMREMGATWKIITEGMEMPKGIEPVGI
jgi:hypothetical protein